MKAICGVDCCSECGRRDECKGCIETDGHPFGGRCIAAEYVRQGGHRCIFTAEVQTDRRI